MSEKNTKLLEKLKKKMTDSGMEEVKMVYAKDGEVSVDVLTTLHRGFGSMSNLAEGEFYFLDGNDDEPDHFVARIAIGTDIPSDAIPELSIHIALINAELVAGAYEYDAADDELAYALKVPVSDGLTDSQLYDMADTWMATALLLSEQYASDLVQVTFSDKRQADGV